MKTLCKILGGSHLYHLNNENSDIDHRGVFMHTDPAFILGTKRHDETRRQNEDEDTVIKELNHFAALLKKSNTEALELLFADASEFIEMTPEFQMLREFRLSFIDSERLFRCLSGYIQGERRLAMGERTGRLGSKRYEQIKKYGYSPKNVTQLIRLANMGARFFSEKKVIVNCRDFGKTTYDLLLQIKNVPEMFTKAEVELMISKADGLLKFEYDRSLAKEEFTFNEDLMNQLLLEFYSPYLK